MAIDNPRVIWWTDAVARPLAEKIRDLKAEIDDALVTWYDQIAPLTPNDSTPIANIRQAQGVGTITGADLNGLVSQAAILAAALDAAGVAGTIGRPCVRPLRILEG